MKKINILKRSLLQSVLILVCLFGVHSSAQADALDTVFDLLTTVQNKSGVTMPGVSQMSEIKFIIRGLANSDGSEESILLLAEKFALSQSGISPDILNMVQDIRKLPDCINNAGENVGKIQACTDPIVSQYNKGSKPDSSVEVGKALITLIGCFQNPGAVNHYLECVNNFNNSDAVAKMYSDMNIPPDLTKILNAYVAYENGDYWKFALAFGQEIACVVIKVVTDVDICGIMAELQKLGEMGEAIYNAAADVVNFFADLFGGGGDDTSQQWRAVYHDFFGQHFDEGVNKCLLSVQDFEKYRHDLTQAAYDHDRQGEFAFDAIEAASNKYRQWVIDKVGEIIAAKLGDFLIARGQFPDEGVFAPTDIISTLAKKAKASAIGQAGLRNAFEDICSVKLKKDSNGWFNFNKEISYWMDTYKDQGDKYKTNEVWCRQFAWDLRKDRVFADLLNSVNSDCPASGKSSLRMCQSPDAWVACENVMDNIGHNKAECILPKLATVSNVDENTPSYGDVTITVTAGLGAQDVFQSPVDLTMHFEPLPPNDAKAFEVKETSPTGRFTQRFTNFLPGKWNMKVKFSIWTAGSTFEIPWSYPKEFNIVPLALTMPQANGVYKGQSVQLEGKTSCKKVKVQYTAATGFSASYSNSIDVQVGNKAFSQALPLKPGKYSLSASCADPAFSTPAVPFELMNIPAPTNLTASFSGKKIALSWKAPGAGEEGFQVERKLTTGGDYQKIAEIPANTPAFEDDTIKEKTKYSYHVNAYKKPFSFDYSNEIEIFSQGSAPSAPPSNLTAALSGKKVALSWKGSGARDERFQLQRKTAGGTYQTIADTAANAPSFDDDKVTEGTSYTYHVNSYTQYGSTDFSPEVTIMVKFGIQERSKSDRTAFSAPPPALPDISVVPQLTIAGKPAKWGEITTLDAKDAERKDNGRCFFTIKFSTQNIGKADTGAFKSGLGDAGTSSFKWEQQWSNLAPGASDTKSAMIDLLPGQTVLWLVLDPTKQVKDSNTGNNTIQLPVTLTGSCLTPMPAAVSKPVTPAAPGIKKMR